MAKSPKVGPIGNGWVQRIETKEGVRYLARWNAYAFKDGKRCRIICGPHELGPEVRRGTGLKKQEDAERKWDEERPEVFARLHPTSIATLVPGAPNHVSLTPASKVADFIKLAYEPRRVPHLEENSRINWEYYREKFLLPFFGDITLEGMNNEDAIRAFMDYFGKEKYSDWTAGKAYDYVKAILELSRNLGITSGNAAMTIPVKQRMPKGVKKSKGQPHASVEVYLALLDAMPRPRDRKILKLLFLCAVRRSEFLVVKWKDFVVEGGRDIFNIQRSFCSRTHKVKEWNPDLKAHGKVVVPPVLAAEIRAWAEHGDTDASDPESYVFPTRTGKCLIPTNWIEDVLKPAGKKAQAALKAHGVQVDLSGISPHWFRRGHATVQGQKGQVLKNIQGQMRHSKAETTANVYMQYVDEEIAQAVVNLEQLVEEKAKEKAKAHAAG